MSKALKVFFYHPNFNTVTEYVFNFELNKYLCIVENDPPSKFISNIKFSNWYRYIGGSRFFTIKNYKIV